MSGWHCAYCSEVNGGWRRRCGRCGRIVAPVRMPAAGTPAVGDVTGSLELARGLALRVAVVSAAAAGVWALVGAVAPWMATAWHWLQCTLWRLAQLVALFWIGTALLPKPWCRQVRGWAGSMLRWLGRFLVNLCSG